MAMKITRAPTLHTLSTEVQTLLHTSSIISSELATLLRTTQQILTAHNELKNRIKTVSEGLLDVVKVEEGVVTDDKDAFLTFGADPGSDIVFGKTPPTTPPTLALGDPGLKIWRPRGQEEDDKDGFTNNKKNLKRDRSSQQSSHSNSPANKTTQINTPNGNSSPNNSNGYQKQKYSPNIPGAYVFSEVSSPVAGERDVLEAFGLGSGGDEPFDVDAVLAQLAAQEREDADMTTRKATEEGFSSKHSSKPPSKKSTPPYRASPPGMTVEKIFEQGQLQQQNYVWKPSNNNYDASPPKSTTKNNVDSYYAVTLNNDAEDVEYVDSPHDSPPNISADVSANNNKSGYAYVNNQSNGLKSSMKTSAVIPTVDNRNGRPNGAYSYTYSNGNGATTATDNNHINHHTGQGTTPYDHQATIRAAKNGIVHPRPSNAFATSTLNENGAHAYGHVPPKPTTTATATATATRATKVPLRSASITPTVSKSTSGSGKGKGQAHETNAEIGSSIVRPQSAMSNASASSNVMSPPYAVFHPTPVRKSSSESGSDSDSDSESQAFIEKMLERASDTEGVGRNKEQVDKDRNSKGKGKEREREKVVPPSGGVNGVPATASQVGDNNEARVRQTSAENSSSSMSKAFSAEPAASSSSSKPNSRPPSLKSNSSPKAAEQVLADGIVNVNPQEDTTKADAQSQSQSDSSAVVATPFDPSPTPENTPVMPSTTASRLPSQSQPNASVSTFSYDMVKSPQAGAVGQRSPDPGETPRIGNLNGSSAGGSGGGFISPPNSTSAANANANATTVSLSFGAVGEALQSMSQVQSGSAGNAGKNGIPSSASTSGNPPSSSKNGQGTTPVVSSTSSSRNSTVSAASLHPSSPASSSSSGGGGSSEGGSPPGSSNASPDRSPDVLFNFSNGNFQSGGLSNSSSQVGMSSNVNGLNGNGNGHSHHSHGGHSSSSSTVSTSEMFARATVTRPSHLTNLTLSYSNGNGMNGHHHHHNVNNMHRDGGDRIFGGSAGQSSLYAGVHVPPGSTSPSSLTRHASLRREREQERERERARERESQRPIPSPVRASSARRSTMKMASAKTNSSTAAGVGAVTALDSTNTNGNAAATNDNGLNRNGRHGHSRTMSDSSTISNVTPTQANFSSFHFNHFPGTSSSSSSSQNHVATISALPTFQNAVIPNVNVSSGKKLERWIPSLGGSEEKERKKENVAIVNSNGVNGNGGTSGNINHAHTKPIHEVSPSSTSTSSSSSSSSGHHAQPQLSHPGPGTGSAAASNGTVSNNVNGNGNGNAGTSNPNSKVTFEW